MIHTCQRCGGLFADHGSEAIAGTPCWCGARQQTSNAQPTPNVEIEVGKYTLRPFHVGSIWLEHESGEGMQVPINDFETVLDKYYRKNF